MKSYPIFALAALFLSLVACDSSLEEVETICLPVNMTITQVQGSMTNKIIADFHYIPETDLIDHITWSNHQTHYFTYDASGRLSVVRAMKVEYMGNLVTRESEYEVSDNGQTKECVRIAGYEYDVQGNLVSSTVSDPRTGETLHQSMSYDQSKHPFGALRYYFNGESFVNNMTSKSVVETEFDYTYELRLNEYEYPETIYEKLGSSSTRIFKYSYIIQ
jgi:hypothetical protein